MYPEVTITKAELETKYNDWISEEKIVAAFKGFESKKLPGPDGIKPITLKNLPQSIIKSIKMIYEASIALHFTLTKWKSSKVVYIPKVGKDDYALSAISNTVHKIEKHILNGEHCMGLFLDIQAAFDSITPEHIKELS